MRTTLDLDDDVLQAVRELARERGTSMGDVLSELARLSLRSKAPPTVRNGVPLFTPTNPDARPGLEVVNRLRDEA